MNSFKMDQNDILKVDQSDIFACDFWISHILREPQCTTYLKWINLTYFYEISKWIIMDQNIILSWSTCKGPYNFLRNFGTPAKNIPQKLKNRMVKTVFENSKFLPSKITCKNFYLFIRPWGQKILQAIFDGKNFEFSKTVFTIRFWRLWRMFLSRVQKFSEILKYFLWWEPPTQILFQWSK